jgi:hypothetical protein
LVVGSGKRHDGGWRRQWRIGQGWEARWDGPTVYVCQEGSRAICLVKSDVARGIGAPNQLLVLGTGVGVSANLMGSKMHRPPIGAGAVSPKSRQRPNNTIGRPIRSAGGDALVAQCRITFGVSGWRCSGVLFGRLMPPISPIFESSMMWNGSEQTATQEAGQLGPPIPVFTHFIYFCNSSYLTGS